MAQANGSTALHLTEDQADDVLFFARAGQVAELQETLTEIVKAHGDATQADDKSPAGQEARGKIIAEAKNESGNTALHYCCANGHQDCLNYLLSIAPSSALVAQNESCNTPLHWAALNGHLAVVETLVKAIDDSDLTHQASSLSLSTDASSQQQPQYPPEGASEDDPPPPPAKWDIRNKAGRGPMSEAQLNSQEKVVQYLLESMVVGSNQKKAAEAEGKVVDDADRIEAEATKTASTDAPAA